MSDNTPLDVSGRVQIFGTYCIASGHYTDVWDARLDGEPDKVVVRMMRGSSSSDQVWVDNLKKRLLSLGEVWIRLHHKNVSRFLGFTFTLQPMPGLVLPFYPNGNIIQYLAAKPDMPIQKKVELIQKVARAVEYLHYFDPVVVHGDIRGSNILIDAKEEPILCDYGLSFFTYSEKFASPQTVGFCRWIAPEVMNPPEREDDGGDSFYTKESDVYAFGMTMLEIMTGEPPFASKKNDSSVIFIVLANKRPQLPPVMVTHEKLGALVEECWVQAPKSRPDMHNVCLRLESDILGPKVEDTEVPSAEEGWFSFSIFRQMRHFFGM